MLAARPRRWSAGAVAALVLASSLVVTVLVATPGRAATAPAASAPAPGLEGLFTRLTDFRLGRSDRVRVRPRAFAAYDVDTARLGRRLADAPSAATAGTARAGEGGPLRLRLPDPTGRLVAFDVVEDSILEPALAAAHPEIRTLAGRAVDDPSRTVRLDLTPMGLHASVRSIGTGRSWYVDPAYNARGTTAHLSYFRSALPERPTFVEKGVRDLDHAGPEAESAGVALAPVEPGGQVPVRTYRLAFATDPAYAAYFGSENVFAEKVTLMNRVNQIYLDDFAIRMVLVEGTDTVLNFDTVAEAAGPDGPCGEDPCYDAADLAPETGGCSGALLDSNVFALGQTIGADNYDIGHIGLGINGGGIAGLGVVGESQKAAGCTGLPFPDGDFYAIDYVAHEMGHQFAGNHTFNGNQGNCSLTNRNGGTSVEPGSGSSVMAYAGICAQDDLQPHTDPYFSQRSIDEVTAHVTAEPSSYGEVQVVTLRGFDTDGESVTLRYPGGGEDVTITRGPLSYNGATVGAQMVQLTGEPVTVGGYHGDPLLPNDGGFYVEFPASAGDVPRLEVVGTTGDVEAFLGVEVDGGPGTNQGVATPAGNRAPTVLAPADRTVPVRTPFTLTGSGSDPDGDALVYLWEQNDEGQPLPTGGAALTSNTKSEGPLFRVFGTRADVSLEESLEYESPDQNLADGSPSRTFPDLAQVLDGPTNAATGTCPAPPADPEADVPPAVVDCFSEFLPTSDYAGTMTFRLTGRDLAPGGGGTQHDETVLTVDDSAGPFLVTSRATAGEPALAGTTETVTWDVNGTDAPDLAPEVRVSLSTDGGRTYPHVLQAATPNDGSVDVTWPQVSSDDARLRVEAVGNYFFDVNDADFTVVDRSAPATRVSGSRTFLPGDRARLRLASDEQGATFACRLDGRVLPCGRRVVLDGLAPGEHTFTAAATDSSGNTDRTPVVRRLVVPVDDRRLTRATSGWRRVDAGSAYDGTLTEARARGQVLVRRVNRATRVVLVAPTGPGLGTVRVFLGDRQLRTVRLGAQRRKAHAVIGLATFARPVTGRIRLVTQSGKPVRIDGLGIGRR